MSKLENNEVKIDPLIDLVDEQDTRMRFLFAKALNLYSSPGAKIRLPQSAEPLLPFCRRSKEHADNAYFDTYADLVTFTASCGLLGHEMAARRTPVCFHLEAATLLQRVAKNTEVDSI